VTWFRGKPYGLQNQIYRRLRAARPSREGRSLETAGNVSPREMTITLETRNRIPLMLFLFFLAVFYGQKKQFFLTFVVYYLLSILL
ncbi:MAG: hypothetical protein J6R32_08870, partial [Bacteroidales bacterium]|nr:hypothetical protein [Bacteroidales bacterium]